MFDLKSLPLYKRHRARRKLRRRGDPSILMIQTASMCNLKCRCCPYPVLSRQGRLPAGLMSDELFAKILREGPALHPKRVSPYWNNEPLLDPRFAQRLPALRQAFGDGVCLHISTNATRLDPPAWPLLAGLLDRMHLSVQGGITRPERLAEHMPGVDVERYQRNIQGFFQHLREHGGRLRLDQVVINNVIPFASEGDFQAEKRFWEEKGATLNFGGFNSFSGMIGLEGSAPPSAPTGPVYGCGDKDRPIQAMHILFDGSCVLCCNDWVREVVVGDANHTPLTEIWHGEAYRQQARLIYAGQALTGHMCARCDLAVR